MSAQERRSGPQHHLETARNACNADIHIVPEAADTTCRRCGRLLTNQRSIRLGWGRVCWAREVSVARRIYGLDVA